MSFKESAPLLTKESATAPLKALEMLAMRIGPWRAGADRPSGYGRRRSGPPCVGHAAR